MDAVRKLSTHSGELKIPELHNHSGDNIHLAVTEDLIKPEQNIIISSYGSIVGTGDTCMMEGSNATTFAVADGSGQETIKIEPMHIKIERIESDAETKTMENLVNIKTEVIEYYGKATVKMEDAMDTNTGVTEKWDMGIWKNVVTKSETDGISQMENDGDAIKTDIKPNVNPCASNQDIRTDKMLTENEPTFTMCEKSFSSKEYLAQELFHTGMAPCQCIACVKSLTQNENFEQHNSWHTGEKLYPCAVCGKSLTKESAITEYKLLYTGEKKHYSSIVSDKLFAHESHLTQHKLCQPGEKPYTCTVCGKSFSLKHHLTEHNLIHTGKKPHSCTVCGKSFIHKAHLARHNLMHTGEKPHSCTVCGKSFRLKHYLTYHSLIHTGEKPHSCTVCGRSFSQKSHLNQHNLTHTGDKPHSCTVCGKSFAKKHDIKQHNLIHTGEKPHSCAGCGKSYQRAYDLRKHKIRCRVDPSLS